MKSKKYLKLIAITLAAAAAVVLAGVLNISSLPVVTIANIPSPEETVTEFLDCIVNKDFDTAASYMYDCSDLGLSSAPENEVERILFEAVTDSYSYSVENVETTGLTAQANIVFTCCDISLMSGDLEAQIMQLTDDATWSGTDIHSTDFILDAVADAAELLSADTSKYLVSTSLELPLVYRNSRWMILFSEELYYTLLGQSMESEA